MSQTLTIRRTRAADLADVDALFRRSYPALLKEAYPPSVMVTVVPKLARARPELILSRRYFAVCDAAGQIVGAGGWSPLRRGGGRRRGEVRHVVTDHRRVREGIGRTLMSHIAETARDEGVEQLLCQSTMMAVPFYTACGFQIVRPMPMALVPGIEFQTMLLRRGL